MDGESVSISIVNDSPLLKLQADICKEGVVNGAAEEEEEREEGEEKEMNFEETIAFVLKN